MKTLLTSLLGITLLSFAPARANDTHTTKSTSVTVTSQKDSLAPIPAWRAFPTRFQAEQFARYVISCGGCVLNIHYDPFQCWWVVNYTI